MIWDDWFYDFVVNDVNSTPDNNYRDAKSKQRRHMSKMFASPALIKFENKKFLAQK